MNVQLRLLLAATLVAVVGMAGFVPAGTAHTRAAGTVRVPKVTGFYLNTAERLLRAHGLSPVAKGQRVYGIMVKADWQVCAQFPRAGRRVRRGTKVSLFIQRPGRC
jgi:beta-lactam-binding protein with PASTA domain